MVVVVGAVAVVVVVVVVGSRRSSFGLETDAWGPCQLVNCAAGAGANVNFCRTGKVFAHVVSPRALSCNGVRFSCAKPTRAGTASADCLGTGESEYRTHVGYMC